MRIGLWIARQADFIQVKTRSKGRQRGTCDRRLNTLDQRQVFDARLAVEALEDRVMLSPVTTLGSTSQPLAAATQTALDSYVAAADSSYSKSLNSTIPGTGYTDYVIDMTSQTWRSPSEVDRTAWHHWLQVIVPTTVKSTTAILEISGGSNSPTPPMTADAFGVQSATTLGAITVVLPTVPNEPLTFAGETSSRTEDQIVAYSFNQYLNGGDQNWPLLLPMVKSAVRAMDTTQSFVAAQSNGTLHVDNFIVTGASKRGWTTWLTPAVDSRVRAIVPYVFDILNMGANIAHHRDTYVGVTQDIIGGYSSAVQDYTNLNVFGRLNTPKGQALAHIVDPYQYLSRPAYNIPKYLIDSTGDQFFVPDSAQFYIHALPGQNYLRYVPNTDHRLNSDAAAGGISFEKALLDGAALPRFSWNVVDAGTTIDVNTIDQPVAVKMWQASNPASRDFRLETFGPNWTSSALVDQGGGHFVAHVNVPATGASAFFVEMTYAVDGMQLTFTTQVSRVQPSSSTLITSSSNVSVFGQPVTLTASLSANAPGSMTPTGIVMFEYDGKTFAHQPITLDSSGAATFSTPALQAGLHTITVLYSGDANYLPSTSAGFQQQVNRDDSNVRVISSSRTDGQGVYQTLYSANVTFNVIVTGKAPGTFFPTAGDAITITDKLGNTTSTIATGTLDGAGHFSFSTRGLAVGTHVLKAVFAGDSNFNPSTSLGIGETVSKAPTATTVTASSNPAKFGSAYSITAAVRDVVAGATGAGFIPTGLVFFRDTFNGATRTIGNVGGITLNGNGQAILNSAATPLAVGTHLITAIYTGSGGFAGKASVVFQEVIQAASGADSVARPAGISLGNVSVHGGRTSFSSSTRAGGVGTILGVTSRETSSREAVRPPAANAVTGMSTQPLLTRLDTASLDSLFTSLSPWGRRAGALSHRWHRSDGVADWLGKALEIP